MSGDALVEALSKLNADSSAYGVSGGGFAVGLSQATATVHPTVLAAVKSGSTINAGGNLTVRALHNIGNDAPITANSTGSAGSLLAGQAGATSVVDLGVAVNALVGDAASLAISDAATRYDQTAITIAADAYNWVDVNATGNAKGLIADTKAYGINASVVSSTTATTTLGESVRIGHTLDPQQLPMYVNVTANSVTEVTGHVQGKAGQTFQDAVLGLLVTRLVHFYDDPIVNIPSVYANGGDVVRSRHH